MKVQRVCCRFTGIIFAGLLILFLFTGRIYAGEPDNYDPDVAPYGSLMTRDLYSGMTGPDVAALQSMLYKLGYLTEEISGCFDQETEAAVIAFQKDHEELDGNGVVNRDTVRVINAVMSGLNDSISYLIYDAIVPVGSSCTINPIFADDQEHAVTLYSDSPLIRVSGMTILALSPGSTEVTAVCEGEVFKFYICIRTEAEIAGRAGTLANVNNVYKGFSWQLQKLAAYSGDRSNMVLFAGDCYLDDRLFLTDFESRFADRNVCSVSISGSTAKQWQTFIQDVYQYQPASLVLCIGMNDLRHGSPVSAAIRNLEILLDMIRQNMPDTTVYWWNIMPHIDSPDQYYKIAAVNAAIRKYAENDSKLIVVDSNAALSGPEGLADASLFLDTLHPNTEGYDRLFEKAAEAGIDF